MDGAAMSEVVGRHAMGEGGRGRLEALFDAIIAIAMTMMALEITVPHLSGFDLGELGSLGGEITVYLISYVVLASVWVVHATLYSSYGASGMEAMVVNLALMFVVTIFPILTRAMSEYPGNVLLACLYVGTYLLMEVMLLAMIGLAKHRDHGERRHQFEDIKALLQALPAVPAEGSRAADVANRANLAEKYRDDKDVSAHLFHELIMSLPQPIQDMHRRKQCRQDLSFRRLIGGLVIGFVTVAASVAALLVDRFLCYPALLIGGAALLMDSARVGVHYETRMKENH